MPLVLKGNSSGVVWIALTFGAILSCGMMIARLYVGYGLRVPPYIAVRLALALGAIALSHFWFISTDELTLLGVTTRLTFAFVVFGVLLLQMKDDERALIFVVVKAARRRLGLAT